MWNVFNLRETYIKINHNENSSSTLKFICKHYSQNSSLLLMENSYLVQTYKWNIPSSIYILFAITTEVYCICHYLKKSIKIRHEIEVL